MSYTYLQNVRVTIAHLCTIPLPQNRLVTFSRKSSDTSLVLDAWASA